MWYLCDNAISWIIPGMGSHRFLVTGKFALCGCEIGETLSPSCHLREDKTYSIYWRILLESAPSLRSSHLIPRDFLRYDSKTSIYYFFIAAFCSVTSSRNIFRVAVHFESIHSTLPQWRIVYDCNCLNCKSENWFFVRVNGCDWLGHHSLLSWGLWVCKWLLYHCLM